MPSSDNATVPLPVEEFEVLLVMNEILSDWFFKIPLKHLALKWVIVASFLSDCSDITAQMFLVFVAAYHLSLGFWLRKQQCGERSRETEFILATARISSFHVRMACNVQWLQQERLHQISSMVWFRQQLWLPPSLLIICPFSELESPRNSMNYPTLLLRVWVSRLTLWRCV